MDAERFRLKLELVAEAHRTTIVAAHAVLMRRDAHAISLAAIEAYLEALRHELRFVESLRAAVEPP